MGSSEERMAGREPIRRTNALGLNLIPACACIKWSTSIIKTDEEGWMKNKSKGGLYW